MWSVGNSRQVPAPARPKRTNGEARSRANRVVTHGLGETIAIRRSQGRSRGSPWLSPATGAGLAICNHAGARVDSASLGSATILDPIAVGVTVLGTKVGRIAAGFP